MHTSGLPNPFMFASSIVTEPDAEIICDPVVGAPQVSSAHTRACIPESRRALTNTTLLPCQASVPSGPTLTATCVVMSEECWAQPAAPNNNPMTTARFSMMKTHFDYTADSPDTKETLEGIDGLLNHESTDPG